jgi:hypothetical protein
MMFLLAFSAIFRLKKDTSLLEAFCLGFVIRTPVGHPYPMAISQLKHMLSDNDRPPNLAEQRAVVKFHLFHQGR